jgi:hypothetical protein
MDQRRVAQRIQPHATACNIMLPLAAFPITIILPPIQLKSCRPVQPNLATRMEAVSIAKSSAPRPYGDSGRSDGQ